MKKYLVIGNPIQHSLSPKLHNFWIKENNIDAIYEKKLLNEKDIEELVEQVRKNKIEGVNITVPFKKSVIPYLDQLSKEAEITKSVNTIYKENNVIVVHNTDIAGFELGIRFSKFNIENKKVFILGAGGVVSSIVFALKKMGAKKIFISNRTKKKAEDIKDIFKEVEVVDWGHFKEFDMIINATSLGLNENDEIKIDFDNLASGKFFYDVIYNPRETNFLKKAASHGHRTENGKYMFIYQAHQSFTIWHKKMPKIDEQTIKLLDL